MTVGKALAVAALAVLPMIAACSPDNSGGDDSGSGPTEAQAETQSGPMFPECGGVSDETVGQLTEVTGLVNTAKTSVGCQWLQGGGILGPHFSFSWFRNSPIGRERKTEELSRDSVDDITIEGYDGFIAVGGTSLCEIGIQFDDDFIEWSVSFAAEPFPDPCEVAKELTAQSIRNSQ